MKAIDKQTGHIVDVLTLEGTAEIMTDGVILYRRASDLEMLGHMHLMSMVKVTLTKDGAYYLNQKGKKRKDGKRWKQGDDYVTLLWKLFPTFRPFFHPDADAPFKNIREA